MTARNKKIAFFVAIAGGVLFPLFLWLAPSSPGESPESKGWHEILQSARSIQGIQDASIVGGGYNYVDLGPDAAKAFVRTNEVPLAAIGRSLQQELLVPVKNSREWMTSHVEDMAKIKRAVHSLITAAKVAEADGKSDEALQIYLDALTLSYRIVRGGLVFDYQNGLSYKALVLEAIEDAVPKMSSADSKRILLTLDRLENDQEPIRAIALRQRAWQRTVLGHRLRSTVKTIVKTRTLYPEVSSLKARGAFQQRLLSVRTKLLAAAKSSSAQNN